MEPLTIGYISLAAIALLIYTGMHVAIVLSLVSLGAMWAIRGNLEQSLAFVVLAVNDSIADYNFGVVPLFVLMGIAVSEAGLGRDTFAAVSRGLAGIRGGLGVATVISNAIFAAITGISIASAAVFSRVAVPEMIRAGYDPRLAVGIVAGSSVLGMLIPPSLLLILFAVLTDTSIGDLFKGGVGPGLLLTLAYCVYLVALGRMKPQLIEKRSFNASQGDRPGFVLLMPVLGLAGAVLGGIYTGFFTPTEAGAVGAFFALVLAFAMRRLDGRATWRIALQTGQITASVSFLIIGASVFGRMLSFSGVPASLTNMAVASGIGPLGFLILFALILVVLGTVLDSASIMLVTVPLAFPIAQQLGIDLIHFGLVTVFAIEIGLLTPPLGMSVFVVASSLKDQGIRLMDVFMGALPFAAIMAVTLLLIILYPPIVTFLVRL